MEKGRYTILSELFKYPEADFIEKVNACQKYLENTNLGASSVLKVFAEYVNSTTIDEQQELFTKTFDVQPICYLDLGYVIFGEDYKRGAFLLNMQTEQNAIQNDCGTDLSDNICNVFTLMDKHPNREFIDQLASSIVIPAVKKMIFEFTTARVDLKMKVLKKLHKAIIQEDLNRGNVYMNCFEAILLVLQEDFKHAIAITAENANVNPEYHQSFFSKKSVNQLVNLKTD